MSDLKDFVIDGKTFVHTNLNEKQEKFMQTVVKDYGGDIKSSVSRKTNYLVAESRITTKYRKAIELIEAGFDIKIISYFEFMSAVEEYKKTHSKITIKVDKKDDAIIYDRALSNASASEKKKLLSGNIVIPAGIKLKNGEFQNCRKITSVTLPEDLIVINRNAFEGCKALEKINFSDKVTHIKSEAFKNCCALNKITIPDSVISIDQHAFAGCLIEEVISCDRVKKLVWNALDKREVALNKFLNSENINDPLVVAYIKSHYDSFFDELLINTTDIGLKNFVTLKKISLDDLENYIEKAENNIEIKSILLEYKTEHYPAAKLEEIQQDKEDKAFGLKDFSLSDWRKVFKISPTSEGYEITGYKETKTEVIIPAIIAGSPVSIGKKAFMDCTYITSVTILNGVTKIGFDAFNGCENLADIAIPDSVTEIGDCAFCECYKLATDNGLVIVRDVLYDFISSDSNAIIPNGVKKIGVGAFQNCNSLVNISIPDSVLEIGDLAFARCTSLTSITCPDSITEIGDYAFEGCISLESITISNSVTRISFCAFECCDNLTIHAPTGSYAEQYAKENNIPFVAE